MAEYAETLEVTGCASLFRMKFADNSVAPFFFCRLFVKVSADLAQGTVDQAAYDRSSGVLETNSSKPATFSRIFVPILQSTCCLLFARLLPHGCWSCG